jgi:hypothetical protein
MNRKMKIKIYKLYQVLKSCLIILTVGGCSNVSNQRQNIEIQNCLKAEIGEGFYYILAHSSSGMAVTLLSSIGNREGNSLYDCFSAEACGEKSLPLRAKKFCVWNFLVANALNPEERSWIIEFNDLNDQIYFVNKEKDIPFHLSLSELIRIINRGSFHLADRQPLRGVLAPVVVAHPTLNVDRDFIIGHAMRSERAMSFPLLLELIYQYSDGVMFYLEPPNKIILYDPKDIQEIGTEKGVGG